VYGLLLPYPEQNPALHFRTDELQTGLMLACKHGSTEIINFYLKQNINFNLTCSEEKSALIYAMENAIENGNLENFQFLIKSKCFNKEYILDAAIKAAMPVNAFLEDINAALLKIILDWDKNILLEEDLNQDSLKIHIETNESLLSKLDFLKAYS